MTTVRLPPDTLNSFRVEMTQHFSPYVIACLVRMCGLLEVCHYFLICVYKDIAVLRGWLRPYWSKELCRVCLQLPAFSSNCPSLVSPLTLVCPTCSNTQPRNIF